MTKKKGRQRSDQADQKPSALQSVGAMIAGVVAVKIVTYLVVTFWRLATREDPPEMEQKEIPMTKKAVWIGLIAATTGAARQLARDWIKPPTSGAA